MRIRVFVNFICLNVMVMNSLPCTSAQYGRNSRCLNIAYPGVFLVTFHRLPIDQGAVGYDGYGWVEQTMKCHKGYWKLLCVHGAVRSTFVLQGYAHDLDVEKKCC
jgi:hypothetical protein